jgi:putative ABC transport system permease protein
VAIALIIATSVMYLQVEFARQRDPGFRQHNLVFIDDLSGRPLVNANKQVLKEQIKALPGVVDASLSSYHPLATTTFARVSSGHGLEGRPGESFILANAFVDENFLPTYDIALVAGRNFSIEQDQPTNPETTAPAATGARSALINEAAARFLGFADPGDAIGKLISNGGANSAGNNTYSIIGVVADNQFYSLKALTRPEIYFFMPALSDVLTVSYQGSAEALMENLQKVWRDTMGAAEFTVSSIEPLLASEFFQEQRESQMLVVFSLFAIFIACLGLYGASAFSVERRTREIGIRKVLGAEIREIVALLLWQFSKPVLFANLIAWPMALWAMLTWLRKFPYQIDVVLLIPLCVLAGAAALSIAWLTVASNTLRVASTKPVLALRYE